MNTDIVVALIVAAGSVVCQILINYSNRRKQESENEKTKSLISYRIEQLENKVNKHNNLIERTYKIEQTEAIMAEEIKAVNHRVDELECYHKP